MKIEIHTQVNLSVDKVKLRFDKPLFEALAPPLMKMKIVEFGGCQKGDRVSIELNSPFVKGMWDSKITKDWETETEWGFIDEGHILPFPFKSWRHQHIVKSQNSGAIIIDLIEFSCSSPMLEALIYPGLYLSFLYRKPVYKRLLNT